MPLVCAGRGCDIKHGMSGCWNAAHSVSRDVALLIDLLWLVPTNYMKVTAPAQPATSVDSATVEEMPVENHHLASFGQHQLLLVGHASWWHCPLPM